MSYLAWFFRFCLLLLILLFSLKNLNPVVINFYGDYSVKNVPLIIVILLTFFIGISIGLIIFLPEKINNRLEIARLRKQIEKLKK